MSAQENLEAARQVIMEAFNKGNYGALRTYFRPEFVEHQYRRVRSGKIPGWSNHRTLGHSDRFALLAQLGMLPQKKLEAI